MFHKIIVVCTGNICRSPIAEAILRRKLADDSRQICSAGTGALVNHPADPMAQLVSLEHSYDISAHRAQQATQTLLNSMDLILTLDATHNEWIRTRYPHLQGRTFKLGHWRKNADVNDPYHKPKALFEQAFIEIDLYIGDWIKRIGSTTK